MIKLCKTISDLLIKTQNQTNLNTKLHKALSSLQVPLYVLKLVLGVIKMLCVYVISLWFIHVTFPFI